MRKLAAESGSGRAVQLVYGDENGKLKMDPEAIDALQQLHGPVAVVSLCGRSRHGKSFVWNQLLSRSIGYQVGSVHRPRAGDLWMWIEPVKRIAEDDTEYNLVLLDVETGDTDDRSDTHSTQIFSLAVLLSSLFIYGPTGSEDDIAVDNLSLLMEIVKHGHDRGVMEHNVCGIEQFSPMFVWLLMDINSNKVDDNSRVSTSASLDSAQERGACCGEDVTAKKKVHKSLQALFPNQERLTLARPTISGDEFQYPDQNSLGKLQPRFLSSIDALMKFVFERTKPKQIGDTTLTGLLLACFAKGFIDSLNNNVVPKISSSWQNVEELECRRAYEKATDAYLSSLKPMEAPDEFSLTEAHSKAVLKAMSAFNGSAVGNSETRQKYETNLRNFYRKAFEDHKKVVCMEADSRCCKAIEDMGKKLQTVCRARDAHISDVDKALDTLVEEYEVSIHGPRKWQKLSSFLRKSLQDILVHRGQNHTAELLSENNLLMSQHHSMENTVNLLKKQLEGGENLKNEYQKRYKDAIDDMKKISDQYKSRIHELGSKCRSVKDEYSNQMEKLEFTRQEALEWKRKYEEMLDEKRVDSNWTDAKDKSITRCNGGSIDWKIKYENSVREAKDALQRAVTVEEKLKEAVAREDAIKAQFSRVLDDKEKKLKEKAVELANSEQQLAALRLELKNAELKVEKFSVELADLKPQIRVLNEKYESVKSQAEMFETEALVLKREKTELEEKYHSCVEELGKVKLRIKMVESEAETLKELMNSTRAEEEAASRNKENEIQRLFQEKQIEIDKAKGCIEDLEKRNTELVALLDTRMKEKEKEIAELQRNVSAQKENIGDMRVENSFVVSSEAAETPKVKRLKVKAEETYSGSELGKESSGGDAVAEEDEEDSAKQARGGGHIEMMTPRKCTTHGAMAAPSAVGSDHSKYTMKTLRSEITRHGFGSELVRLKNPRKRDLVDLYERCVLRKE
ncbi:PREDICTED: guanylate-binding protein 1 [Tarenaya hassleriana]|uniref:guanylate-binding protein 1 n=1 Tax=Tarenaya hassleriana TaxID=28532 RepID=UPI00053CA46E|nr:PREDICTED: guanylate-binding protein 1 [Tarenaya hassleriana]